ncbi:hypothetical protein BV22DRAFT_1133524 [Leucogyrophana mollusca]|uniref:Uncharacterized protein n=1 Tax=Leucogyrophana mollusca TaxID=85980 RepID=A0ACB8B466_9AGAM|nr:hypothetical protein BV22DRAFT_1133524 [Leucogyrophana mollusca]
MLNPVPTIIAPVTVAYIVYLIVSVSTDGKTIPITLLIMIGIHTCLSPLALANNATPLQRAGMYKDGYDEPQSLATPCTRSALPEITSVPHPLHKAPL